MKGNDFLENISDIDDDLLDESERPLSKKKNGRIKFFLAAAVFVLAVGAVVLTLALNGKKDGAVSAASQTTDPSTEESNVLPAEETASETSPEPETEPETEAPENRVFDPEIIWYDKEFNPGASQNEAYRSLSENVAADLDLSRVLEEAGDGDVIAFNVNLIRISKEKEGRRTRSDPPEVEELKTAYYEAESEYGSAFNAFLTSKQEEGMGSNEAAARWQSTKEYETLREKVICAKREYYRAVKQMNYSLINENISYLESLGFTKLYDVFDPEYEDYFFIAGGRAVMCGTKAEIMSLKNESEYLMYLCVAYKDAEKISFDNYIYVKEITLLDGEKLSEELKNRFEQNDVVRCKVYFNLSPLPPEEDFSGMEKWEREDRICQMMGLSGMDELESSNDPALYDKFYEILNGGHRRNEEKDALSSELLKENELVEINYFFCYFVADLTYDRANELIASERVAFIDENVYRGVNYPAQNE